MTIHQDVEARQEPGRTPFAYEIGVPAIQTIG
jgi:hypothetical protein